VRPKGHDCHRHKYSVELIQHALCRLTEGVFDIEEGEHRAECKSVLGSKDKRMLAHKYGRGNR
jgi:hypothetical protein